MTILPSNLAKRLRAAGLTVVEIDGWESRGRPGVYGPVGVLNHHTGSFDRDGDLAEDLAYAKWLFLTGRSDLPAPLCALALSVEGTVYLGSAGRTNHAGVSRSSGSVAAGDGNSLYVGIEWMLSGTQRIPDVMYQAGVKMNAVLLDVLGSSAQAVSSHYQTSVTGKWDIGDPDGVEFKGKMVLDVAKFRRAVKEHMNAPEPEPVKQTLRASLKRWRGFVHLKARFYQDYGQAVRLAAKRGRGVDVDVQQSKERGLWALHWKTVGKNRLHDPRGKIPASARIADLTNAQISRLRGPNGQRPRRLGYILRLADRLGVRVELELKSRVGVKRLSRLVKRFNSMNARGDLQFKTLAELPGSLNRLGPAYRAGGTTILSFTGYKGSGINKARASRVTDYVRGNAKWSREDS